MSELTRAEVAATREELRRDTRLEFRLIWQAVVAIAIIAAVIWVRVEFFE